MNNVIFLDIDGVLNSPEYIRDIKRKVSNYEFYKDPFYSSIDPKKIELLNKLLEKKDIKIVISSSWRRKGLRAINKSLRKKGLKKDIEYTTSLREMDRGLQILEFINLYEINNYAVVDDDISTIIDYIPENRIVKIEGSKGIVEEDLEKIQSLMI